MIHTCIILGSFTRSIHIGTNAFSLLWVVPLIASISIVYKATKVSHIDAKKFTREVVALFGSILGFIVIAALILMIISWFINDKLYGLTQ